MIHPFSFSINEHLKLKKSIETVALRGKSLKASHIKMLYAIEPAAEFSCQITFVAPKKLHHLAVDRNRCKRLMREAYRLNRQLLTSAVGQTNVHIMIMLVAQNTEPMSFGEVDTCVKQLLERLSEKVCKICANF